MRARKNELLTYQEVKPLTYRTSFAIDIMRTPPKFYDHRAAKYVHPTTKSPVEIEIHHQQLDNLSIQNNLSTLLEANMLDIVQDFCTIYTLRIIQLTWCGCRSSNGTRFIILSPQTNILHIIVLLLWKNETV